MVENFVSFYDLEQIFCISLIGNRAFWLANKNRKHRSSVCIGRNIYEICFLCFGAWKAKSFNQVVKIIANINILPLKNIVVGLTILFCLTARLFMLQGSLLCNSTIVFAFGSFSASFIFSSILLIVFLMIFFLGVFHRKNSVNIFFSLYFNRVFLCLVKFMTFFEGCKFVVKTLIYFFP